MITENYVSFETAKLLKEKGFRENCIATYNLVTKNFEIEETYQDWTTRWEAYVSAPTLQMAMKWLREVYNIDVVIDTAVGMLGVKVYVPLISTYEPLKDSPSKVRQIKRGIYYKDDNGIIPSLQHFDSYEQACEAAIKYCLENLI